MHFPSRVASDTTRHTSGRALLYQAGVADAIHTTRTEPASEDATHHSLTGYYTPSVRTEVYVLHTSRASGGPGWEQMMEPTEKNLMLGSADTTYRGKDMPASLQPGVERA